MSWAVLIFFVVPILYAACQFWGNLSRRALGYLLASSRTEATTRRESYRVTEPTSRPGGDGWASSSGNR